MYNFCWSQWPHGLRRGCSATRLLGMWVRIPPETWKSISCEGRVLSERDLCVGLITRPEEFYWVSCVWVWSWGLENEEALKDLGLLRHGGGTSRGMVMMMWNLLWFTSILFILKFYIETHKWGRCNTMGLNHTDNFLSNCVCSLWCVLFACTLKFCS